MQQPILVQKYGGSSVADPQRLKQVAERVVAAYRQGYRVVVVVSAMGDSTDHLMTLARDITHHPHRRELDMLLSAGERISMALLSMAIQELGCEAISFTGSQSGILTNDRHFDARIIEVRPIRIQDELERGKIVIVAGFQGMSYKREITTLGRGGSDTTAVALAAALGAEACEICSDVDGIYEADPRVIPEAQQIASLSYEEMEALSRAGAKVLHADAVAWARQNQVALYARATSSTFGEPSGTLIRRDRDLEDDNLMRPAIACMNDLCWMTLDTTPEHHGKVAAWWKTFHLSPLWSHWNPNAVQSFFRRDDEDLLQRALAHAPPETHPTLHNTPMACISLVGQNMSRDPQWLCRGMEALATADPDILVYQTHTDALRASFIVEAEHQARTQQILYASCLSHRHNGS